jgi:hypothetical protein
MVQCGSLRSSSVPAAIRIEKNGDTLELLARTNKQWCHLYLPDNFTLRQAHQVKNTALEPRVTRGIYGTGQQSNIRSQVQFLTRLPYVFG